MGAQVFVIARITSFEPALAALLLTGYIEGRSGVKRILADVCLFPAIASGLQPHLA